MVSVKVSVASVLPLIERLHCCEDIDRQNAAVIIETQRRQTCFAIVAIAVGDTKAVIGNYPSVGIRDLDDGVVTCSLNQTLLSKNGIIRGLYKEP